MTGRGASRAAAIVLCAAACVAAPASLAAQDISCERGDQEVRALEFRGNRAIRDNELAVRVVTTVSSRARRWLHLWFAEKRCLNHDELPRDVLRLEAYYRERGYYSADVDTLVQPMGKDAVRVIFNISEGEPTRLTSYSVTGLDGVRDSADIVRRLRLRVGAPFDFSLFRADMDTIVRRLRDAGYFKAEVLPGYDRDTSRIASATITVLPGKRARFAEPDPDVTPADGRPQQIPDPVIKRVMGISAGQQYSDRAIIDAQRNLFQLGTYRHIEVAPAPDSLQPPGDTIVNLAVRLSEDYMRQLDSEFGWATLDCARARLQYTDKNLFSKARRLELTGQLSKIGYGYPLKSESTRRMCTLGNSTDLRFDQFSDTLHYFLGATLRQPRLLGTRWVPTVSLYSERRGEFRAYLRSTPIGADFSATRDVGDRMPLRLGYAMEYGNTDAPDAAFCALFNRCDEQSRSLLREPATLGVASAALARLRTDNFINPTRGYSMRGELRTSSSRLLGTSNLMYFNKGTGDVAWYARIDSRNTVAFRLRGGLVLGRQLSLSDPVGFVPPQERLYAGGPTSVRGFQQNELGALVYILRARPRPDTIVTGTDTTYHFLPYPDSLSLERAVPLGGNSLVVANIEYRIKDPFLFPDLLQYLLFVDGGDVWSRNTTTNHGFKWTPGFGLRALTPVGPVQINVAYNNYERERGALYYNPDVRTLLCVTPGNTVTYRVRASTVAGESPTYVQTDETAQCSQNFDPPPRTKFAQRLTFTFSIGTDF